MTVEEGGGEVPLLEFACFELMVGGKGGGWEEKEEGRRRMGGGGRWGSRDQGGRSKEDWGIGEIKEAK